MKVYWAEDPDAVLRARYASVAKAQRRGYAIGRFLAFAVALVVVIGLFFGLLYAGALVVRAAWGGP